MLTCVQIKTDKTVSFCAQDEDGILNIYVYNINVTSRSCSAPVIGDER